MSLFDKIKDIDLVEYAKKIYGEPKIQNWNYWFKSWNEKTPSLVIYADWKKNWYFDYSKNWWWTIIDMCMNQYNLSLSETIKKLKEEYKIEESWILVKPKTTKRDEILENFENFRNNWNNSIFNQFLQNRWFDFDFLQNNQETINEVAKEFWVAEWVRICKDWDKSIFKNCIIFPCYDSDWDIIWSKIRRADNEKIWQVKSLALKWWKTWLIYTKEIFESEEIIICEWEADYLVLKALWFKNVIWNLGWVASWINEIKNLTKKVKSIISFYDNDEAWKKANLVLQTKLNRPVKEVHYQETDWQKNKDINDLFKIWFTKDDFQEMIENASFIQENEIINEIDEDEKDLIIEKNNWYYTQSMTKDWWIIEVRATNFKIEIQDIVLYDTEWQDFEKRLILKIFNTKHSVIWEFSSRQTTDTKSFSSKIRSLETSFSCYDMKQTSLESIIRYIHKWSEIKNTIIVKQCWFIKKFNIWVFSNWIYSNWKFSEYNENKVCDIWAVKIKLWIDDDSKLPTYQEDLYYNENIKNDIIWDFRYMFNWFSWDLVLWFLMSSLFVNNLTKEMKPFPILFVNGKKWTWKTTAVDYAIRILWLEISVLNFETSSEAIDQLHISQNNSLPIWRDEYKNVKRIKEKDWFIKSVFDRNWVSKWTYSASYGLGEKTYPVNATLLLSWEETPNDDAVFSRCCMINVNKNRNWWAEKFEEIKKRVDYYWSVFRSMLETYDFNILVDKFKKIYDETKIYLVKEALLEKRILNVYLPVISWFIFYKKIILKEKITSEDFEIWLSSIIDIISTKIDEENEYDIVNEFFQVLLFLYSEWHVMNYNSEFIKINWENIQIAFTFLYSYFNEYQKKQWNRQIPAKDLQKYLNDEFWAKRSNMTIDWKWCRSIMLNKNNIPKNLELLVENIILEKK